MCIMRVYFFEAVLSHKAHLNSWGPSSSECYAFWWNQRPLVVRKVKSHSRQSFLGGSCPPCFLNLCIAGTLFLVQELSHSSQLPNSALCLTTLCILRVSFLVHVLSHELHSNVVYSSSLWFLLKCAHRVPFLAHTYLHRSHFFCL